MTAEQQPETTLAVLRAAADAVERALEGQTEWGPTGAGHGQYHHDTVADAAAIAVLDGAGFGVFSEESGRHHPDRAITVVLDPVDGSTNASRHLPWWAISLCALDADGPVAALVACPPTSDRYEACRGRGATRNGLAITASAAQDVHRSIIGFNGYPTSHYGWAQARILGAAALDLCAVASGALDGFVDCSFGALAPWDYLGGLLICQEAGAVVDELHGRDLVTCQPGERRTLVAAGTGTLLGQLKTERLKQGPSGSSQSPTSPGPK